MCTLDKTAGIQFTFFNLDVEMYFKVMTFPKGERSLAQ